MAKDTPVTPTATPAAPAPQPDEGLLHELATSAGLDPEAIVATAKAIRQHPWQVAKEVGSAQAGEFVDAGHHLRDTALSALNGVASAITNPEAKATAIARLKSPGLINKIQGAEEYATAAVPLVGGNYVKAEEQAGRGNIAGSIGTTLGTTLPLVTDTEGAEGIKAHLAETGKTFVDSAKEGLQRAAVATAPEGSAEAGFAKIPGSKKVRGATPKPTEPVEPTEDKLAAVPGAKFVGKTPEPPAQIEIQAKGPAGNRHHIATIDGEPVGSVGYATEPSGVARTFGQYVQEEHRGKGIAPQLIQSVINEARANGAKSIISDPAGLSPEANRVWEKVRNSGVPLENITHPTGEPGYQLDFTKQSPATAAGEAPEYHPDLQKIVDAPGVTVHQDPTQLTNPHRGSFIAPDGKYITMPAGAEHDKMIDKIRPNALQEEDSRINFLNDTGAMRVRPAVDRAGQTLHITVPKDGVTPEQVDALKRAVGGGMKSRGNLLMDTADAPLKSRDSYKEVVSPADIDEELHKVGAYPDQAKAVEAAKVEPNPDLQASAQKYAKAQGMPEINHEPMQADAAHATEIAKIYDEAKHDPNNPRVKAAYDALKSETLAQFHHLRDDLGLKFKPQAEDPYKSAGEMMDDIRKNNRLKVWNQADLQSDHPMAEIAPGTGGQTYNTVFRWVHDSMGHAAGGNDFSENGEKSATEAHAQMYSDTARPAMRNETEGQTSWFFHNPEIEAGRAKPGTFPGNKAAILPDESLEDKLKKGVSRDNPITTNIPLSKISVSENAYTGASRNLSKGAGSKTTGPVQLAYNPANGQFLVEDGMHRIVQANRNNDATIQATIHSAPTDAANVAKGTEMNLEPTPWHEVAGDAAETDEAGGIDPHTGKSDTTGLGTEILPEARQPLDHAPTAKDFAKFYDQHKDLFDKHPELRIGWDNKSAAEGGHEINIGAVGPGAEAVARKLDQKSAFNIEKGEVIPTGGTGLKTKFPKSYSIEKRLADLKNPSPFAPSTGGTPEAPAAGAAPAASKDIPTVSTRVPTKTVKGEVVEDHTQKDMTSDMDAAKAAPGYLQKMVDRTNKTPGFTPPEGDALAHANAYIRHAADNIKFVLSKMLPEAIKRDEQWYPVGAHERGLAVAKQHGFTPSQIFGVTSVESPMTDWDQNTSLAERTANIWKNQQNTKFTPEMKAAGNAITSLPANASFKPLIKKLQGKTLAELPTTELQALWLRLYDEGHNPREYETWNPDGTSNGLARNMDGTPRRVGWSFQSHIQKAIEILKDGSPENISKQLGYGHKVRNFYNNQMSPNDPRFLTMDTHAINVAQLRPMSGKSPAVGDNFGHIKNGEYGLKGTYALHDAAYRLAAKELDIPIPSRLQSPTWTKIRDVFTDDFKTPENQQAIDAIWKEHSDGKITADQARNRIWDYATEWNRENAAGTGAPADQGKLFAAGVSGEPASGTGRGTGVGTPREVPEEELGSTDFNFGANVKDVHAENTAKVAEMMKAKQEAMQKGLGKGLKKK